MLKIEITDPHLMPPQLLIDTASLLMRIAGIELLPKPKDAPKPSVIVPHLGDVPVMPLAAPPLAPVAPLAPPPSINDNLPSPAFNPFASAPVAPVAPPPAPAPSHPRPSTPGVELDANDLPWDNRIHSRTKSKTADGAWKLQRGIDMKLVAEVTKELESVMAIPAPSAPAPIAVANITPVPPTPLDGIPITQPSADPIQPTIDFNKLMNMVTAHVGKGKLNHAQVTKACQDVGIPSLPVASTRPDLIPQIYANIEKMI